MSPLDRTADPEVATNTGEVGSGVESRWAMRFGLPRIPGLRGELLILGFFCLATLVLTWPIAITMSEPTGLRGDYFNNLWNVWWLRQAITEGVSPLQTEYLYYPEGLSLWRHTLSPLNALLGVGFGTFLSPHAAFNAVLLFNFAFSAWAFSLLARYVTGSTGGAVLAGMLYSFCPFHYYYICQINVFSLGWLPLVVLFYLRVYREGGWRNTLGAALSTAAVAATAEYYVMYGVIFVALLLAMGRLLDPSVKWRGASVRVLIAGAFTGLAVIAVAWPLLYGTFGPEAAEGTTSIKGLQGKRSNDLFGYEWVGGPEVLTVSWPTMLGYSTLLILLLGAGRILRRQRFFLVVGGLFLLMSLGAELSINREETGIPLLYGFLAKVPGLDMLRKPDRAYLMVQFVAALCLAEAWIALRARLAGLGAQRALWGGILVVTMVELTGVPFARLEYEAPAYLSELAKQDDVRMIAECPPMYIDVMNARYNYFQMEHGKRGWLGYSTLLAKGLRQERQMDDIINLYLAWINGKLPAPEVGFEGEFPDWMRSEAKGVDRLVFYKSMPIERARYAPHDEVVWAPFCFLARDLVGIRQVGMYLDQPTSPEQFRGVARLLRREFGAPLHEDDELIVFDPGGDRDDGEIELHR